jgi:hypothetical protein
MRKNRIAATATRTVDVPRYRTLDVTALDQVKGAGIATSPGDPVKTDGIATSPGADGQ